MSTTRRMFGLIPAAILAIGVGWGLEARAEKVDWSQYIESPSARQPAKQPAPVASTAPHATRPTKQPTKKPRVAQRARAKPKH